ncbi:hypothetical protein F4677DRAFT_441282 [Hypoxylon crocopeplum]|nr:hypothetical protein F4677DRAFT_441282 [Hypoxylon crocopeplum]
MAERNSESAFLLKLVAFKTMICEQPQLWLGDVPVCPRDQALFDAVPVDFVNYCQNSFLILIAHLKRGEEDGGVLQTKWTCENDVACKHMVTQAGGGAVGLQQDVELHPEFDWLHMMVTVNLKIHPAADLGIAGGQLSSPPAKIRIFRGPERTCHVHPWDAMILYDCAPRTDGLKRVQRIASRKWDILLMKMCEDFDFPWVVVSIRDSGPSVEIEP